jgi:O-antigen/teichoic acid export membrane protein
MLDTLGTFLGEVKFPHGYIIALVIFVLGLQVLHMILSNIIKKPKESFSIFFWVVIPYVLAGTIVYVLHEYIGGWSYLIAIIVWGVVQNYTIEKDEEKNIEEKREL